MIGFKEYLDGLKPTPTRSSAEYGDEPPKKGEVENPLYHKDGEKIWGEDEHHYLPPLRPDYSERMRMYGRGDIEASEVDAHNWDSFPVKEISTASLMSPQKELDLHHLENYPPDQNSPISVVRTKSGQHIIVDGNHRAAIAHGTTGKVKARIFQSKR